MKQNAMTKQGYEYVIVRNPSSDSHFPDIRSINSDTAPTYSLYASGEQRRKLKH